MKWERTAFKHEEIARICKKELDEAGIRTDFYTVDRYYYVGWCPMGKEQKKQAIEIIIGHIE